MEYKKEFFEEKGEKKIKITAPKLDSVNVEESRDLDRMPILGTKIFEAAEKEEIYELIKKGQPIDLKNKYVKGFSLKEYRKINGIEASEEVCLKDFNAKEAFFDENVDFSHAFFEGNAYFFGAFFEKGAYFCSARFGDEGVNFGRTIFGEGCVNFMLSTFGKGKVTFRQADFGDGLVDFKRVDFGKGDISFAEATFGEGNVNFRGVTFGGDSISFKDVAFWGKDVDFGKANFGQGNVSFNGVDFLDPEGRISFKNLKAQGDWDMRSVQSDIIDFSNSIIHGTVNLTGARIKKLGLINTQLTGRIFINSKELRLGSKNDAINSQESTHIEKAKQFRLLRDNFRNLGQYLDGDKANVQFMKHRIRDESGFTKNASFKKRFLNFPKFLTKWLIFEHLGGNYGTSAPRAIFGMLTWWFVFSLFYLFPFNIKSNAIDLTSLSQLQKFGYAMYHSIITFLTIGYGDIYPGCWQMRLLSGIEGFIGLISISLLAVIIARKLLNT